MHEVIEDLRETLTQAIRTRDQFIEAVSQEHELVVKNQQTLKVQEQKEDSVMRQIKKLNQSKADSNDSNSSTNMTPILNNRLQKYKSKSR